MLAKADISDTNIQQRRAVLAHKPGAAGLLKNGRTTLIAIFASMGGLIYGYNQGMFGQVLSMYSFGQASGTQGISNPTLAGLLTSILELGAWVGVLFNGYSADRLGRKLSVVVACALFVVGVIIQACVRNGDYDYILGGRFVTGLGVGSLSMIVPLYNAELAPAEIRGSLVALQQLAITFGIMISYWITYGSKSIDRTERPLTDEISELYWRYRRNPKQSVVACPHHHSNTASTRLGRGNHVLAPIPPMVDGSRTR